MRTDKLLAVMGLAVMVAGCATTAPQPESVETVAKDGESKMTLVTGSRIPQSADRVQGGTPSTIYPLYIVDHDELWNTGATSVGGALDHLPFLEVHR